MPDLPSIEPFRQRRSEIDRMMSEPDFFSDQQRARDLSREHQKLGELLALAEQLETVERELADNESILADADADDDLRSIAEEETQALRERAEALRHEVMLAMLPPEPGDTRNTIMEIRAGAGGDEASLFAADLARMYTRFAENRGWKIEPMSSSESEAGGFKEVSFLITGEDVFKTLKFESGVHRVQRIPVTDAGGRIHTSTATVAVLPEAQEVDVDVKPDELEITVARASGPGGQGVNTTDSAVQILHKPTGIIVKCADERSQIKNKAKAMKVLLSRLLEKEIEEEQKKYAANRKSQVGTGDRSERIRTYNFPQSRVTDHRVNLTLHSLNEVVDGALDELIVALRQEDERARLEELVARQQTA